MGRERLSDTLSFRITIKQRSALEGLSELEKMSLGEAARALIDEGLKSRGLANTC